MPAETDLSGRCVPLRSWSRIRNHGDQLSANIVRHLLGAEPLQVGAGEPHVLAVGSITFMANGRSALWGCGILNHQVGVPDLAPHQLRALRGRHSADRFVRHGIRVPDIPLGDPGMFAADLLRSKGLAPRRTAPVVVVPHHGSLRHPALHALARADGVAVADTLNNDWELLQDIAGCDVVISESLRGLIYAESFAKPSVWVSNTEDPNWTFKFHDWFSTTRNPQARPAPMASDLEELRRQAEFRFSMIDKAELLAAFPREEAIDRPARLLAFERCRAMSPMTVFGDDQLAGAFDELARAAPAAFDRIRERVAQLFENWAERPYALVADRRHTAFPTDRQKQVIARELDRRVEIDFAVILDKERADAAGGEKVELDASVSLHPGDRSLDGCLMLRPSLDAFGANHAVFGV